MKQRALVAIAAFALTLAAPAAEAADKKVNLKFSFWVPQQHMLVPGAKEWGESLAKASGGSISVTVFPASQLGKGPDHYDMVKTGIADMGLINPGYTPGRFPVIQAVDLPFLVSDGYKGAAGLTQWYQAYREREMKEVYTCHVFTHEPGTFHAKKKIMVPADVKGLNVRTANQTTAAYVTAMGGNSVQVPIMEAYETLKRGITDAITVPWGGMITFNFGKVVTFHLDEPLYVSTFTHNLNLDTYKSMSAAQRKAVDDHCTPAWSQKIYQRWYNQENELKEKIRSSPEHTSYKITPDQMAQWRKVAEPLHAEWRASVTKAGYNADEVWNGLVAALKTQDAMY